MKVHGHQGPVEMRRLNYAVDGEPRAMGNLTATPWSRRHAVSPTR